MKNANINLSLHGSGEYEFQKAEKALIRLQKRIKNMEIM